MDMWNYNMDDAPKGHYEDTERKTKAGENIKELVKDYVILVSKCGNFVHKSYWIEDQNRWNFYNGSDDEKPHEPIAWMEFEELKSS